ncbi:MAG: hypothetical protein ACK4UN_13295 [Limisphaerales bacterium]
MSIILQNRKTNMFVAHGQWDANQTAATTFDSGLEAYDYCVDQRLPDMDIVLAFRCPSHNVRVPVRQRTSQIG